jgi:regulator of protease activity HflC (stomatin/prohibitin superfamily)
MNRRFMTIVGVVIIWVATWSLGTTGLPAPSGRGTPLQLPIILPVALSLLWWVLNGINVVRQWERRPTLFLGGTYWRTKGPGLCFIEPITVTSLYDVPVQDVVDKFTAPKVQTRNNVSLDIDGVITWCVDERYVKDAVVNVQNVREAVLERTIAIMSDTVGTKDLDDLLHSRKSFADVVLDVVKERLGTWGVNIKSLELKGLKINDPGIEAAIAMNAKADQEGKAELTKAGYQKMVATALNEAAREYDAGGRWLKKIEMLGEISRNPSNTIVLPSEVLDALAGVAEFPKRTDEKPV